MAKTDDWQYGNKNKFNLKCVGCDNVLMSIRQYNDMTRWRVRDFKTTFRQKYDRSPTKIELLEEISDPQQIVSSSSYLGYCGNCGEFNGLGDFINTEQEEVAQKAADTIISRSFNQSIENEIRRLTRIKMENWRKENSSYLAIIDNKTFEERFKNQKIIFRRESKREVLNKKIEEHNAQVEKQYKNKGVEEK